jgi:sporulation protein YlmC with PRC-barrel domain
MHGLPLVHDVLDAQLLDRRKQRIGRVDDVALELRPGQPLRVATVLVGGPVRARRIGRVAVWINHLLRAIGRVRSPGVSRIPFTAVRTIGDMIELDVDGDTLESGHAERWLAEHVVRFIPGAEGERK